MRCGTNRQQKLCLDTYHFPHASCFTGCSCGCLLKHLQTSDTKNYDEMTYCTPVIRGKKQTKILNFYRVLRCRFTTLAKYS